MNLNLEKIDGLKGIKDRKELIMQEETGIMSLLLEDGRIRCATTHSWILIIKLVFKGFPSTATACLKC